MGKVNLIPRDDAIRGILADQPYTARKAGINDSIILLLELGLLEGFYRGGYTAYRYVGEGDLGQLGKMTDEESDRIVAEAKRRVKA